MEYFPQSDEPQNDFMGINPPLSGPDDKLIPKPCMVFKSEEEVYNFYREYAREVGFGIRRKSGAKDDYGNLKYYILACSREGVCKSVAKNDFNPRASRRSNCKARINCIVNPEGKFTVSSVTLVHSHALSPTKLRFFGCNKNIDAYAKRRLETNDQAGIRVSNNYHSLVVEVGGYKNLNFTEKDCRNHILKARESRLGAGDAASLSMYFACMQKRNPNFFYMFDIDDDNRLKNVFWADARSIAAYESFGDVISFDSTYLTNRYDMPFAPFVGVNHHGQTVLFGCGLLSNEEADTYIWLFKAWLMCMSKAPNAIITDQCKSIQKAVRSVFPNSHHRLCLWHIMKKFSEKLGSRHDYNPIKKVLKRVVYESIEVQEFEETWGNMISDFDLEENAWLSGLYKDRHRWVSVFVKGIFWAGMSATQRSESINAFFDGYVGPKTSLKQFVEQYDNALKYKIEKENKADFASFNSCIPLITNFSFEKQFQDAYTNELFRLFQDEVRGVVSVNLEFIDRCGAFTTFQISEILSSKEHSFIRNVTYNVYYDWVNEDLKCSCRLFQFKGILCRHIVKVLIVENIHQVPAEYVLYRWRKDVRHKHTYVKNCYDAYMDNQFRVRYNHLNSEWAKFPEVGASSVENYECLLSSLDEAASKLSLGDSLNWIKQSAGTSSTIMAEDCQKISSPLKVRTKGRPPSKRKISTVEQKMKNKMSTKARKSKKDHSESENQFGTQESQFGPSEPSTVYQFGTQESLLNYDNDEEDEDEHGETLCGACACGDNYASDEFWICCDICAQWFHGKCVQITPARAEHMKRYKCSACSNNRARRHF